jgi:purine-nucleoside phosphorylase
MQTGAIMEGYTEKVLETSAYIRARSDQLPRVGLLTGTGLAESAESVEAPAAFDYGDIPNFPVSTVASHTGRLLIGKMEGCQLMVLQGRFHLYEGYSPLEVTFPIRVMQSLGVKTVILSNAAGGINPDFRAGDIMLICDHINLTGENPLVGPNDDSWGLRFPDMTQAYDKQLATLAEDAAQQIGVPVRRGVYAGLKGPSLETPAEIRFLRTIGADAVGLSTVIEAITAVHAGMRVLGLSTISNIVDPDDPIPATVEDIIAVANKATPGLEKIIRKVLEKINDSEIG